MIEEEVLHTNEKEAEKFKHIYGSMVGSVSRLRGEDPNDLRTESFQDTLDHTDFKKE